MSRSCPACVPPGRRQGRGQLGEGRLKSGDLLLEAIESYGGDSDAVARRTGLLANVSAAASVYRKGRTKTARVTYCATAAATTSR